MRSDAGAAERPEEGRLAAGIEADDNERRDARLRPDMALPRRQEIEALVGRGQRMAGFEPPPERFRRRQVLEYPDRDDLARARQRRSVALARRGLVANSDVHGECAGLTPVASP